jgi:hypothetical protein
MFEGGIVMIQAFVVTLLICFSVMEWQSC